MGFCTSDGKDAENCCPRSDLLVHILGLAHSGGHKSAGARGVWGDSPSGKFRILVWPFLSENSLAGRVSIVATHPTAR